MVGLAEINLFLEGRAIGQVLLAFILSPVARAHSVGLQGGRGANRPWPNPCGAKGHLNCALSLPCLAALRLSARASSKVGHVWSD